MAHPALSPRLAEAFNRARREVAAWRPLCDALAAEFDGLGTALLPISRSRRFPSLCASASLGPALRQYMTEGWCECDLREQGLPAGRKRGYVLDSDVGPAAELAREPYYRDLVRRHGIGGFVGILFHVMDEEWMASVQLPLGVSSPSAARLERVPLIAAALEEAATAIAAEVDARWSAAFAAFGALNRGVVLLDSTGRIVRKSAVAEAMLGRCGATGAAFGFPDDCTAGHFTQLCRAHPDRPFRPLPYVVRQSPTHSVVAVIERVPEPLRLFLSANVLVVTLSEHNPVEEEIAMLLARDFGLQPSEVRVVLGLCRGEMIKDMARALGIKEGTARQRLKTVFQKTGTNAQHQLVALAMGLDGRFPSAGGFVNQG
ncbi:hypothetical protein D6850_09240 [Roseovarius spongiae]|uniref:HTH luxR-type domain-containing protein n=1 Tax=Roseovarius spongiae TaxID=2320272 RepID=A0A3A8AWF9_9RHOB|nr:hypothetical protein [Roseovarius spongiae]RKF15030.1 hypothetical protein D6850_09240 [Roseovarius spongiae]